MNPDFVALLKAFNDASVRFLVVGAYALALHGRPRATGDLDIWIEPSRENAECVMRGLIGFGAPLRDITAADFAQPGLVYQIGLPPVRIDILTDITGVGFAEAWTDREQGLFGSVPIHYMGRATLIRNKKAIGRAKDLADIEALNE